MTLDKKKAKEILVNELDYKPAEADLFLKDFPEINKELEEAVNKWLENRSVVDVEVGGMTISEFMKLRNYHFLLAIRQLNRVFDDDLTEEEKARLVELLKKPVPKW